MFQNLKLLTNDMSRKNYLITSFVFEFDEDKYIVIVRRFHDKLKKQNQYARVLLHIIAADDMERNLTAEANVHHLYCTAKDIREFLERPYCYRVGDLVKRFLTTLGCNTPVATNTQPSKIEKKAYVKCILPGNLDEANKIYCYDIRRNPNGKHRTAINDAKAAVLVPDLHHEYQEDDTLSFWFSADPTKEKSVMEIMTQFAERRE